MKYNTLVALLLAAFMAAPVAHATDIKTLLEQAASLRADEFSPAEYKAAIETANDRSTVEAEQHASKAIANCMTLSREFTPLIESRDRMQLAKAAEVRKDLADRAEEAFADVVSAIESGDMPKAKTFSKHATLLTHQAEVVAAREQLSRPISKRLSEARAASANIYAPKLYASVKSRMQNIDKMIRDNPAAQGQSVSELQKGLEEGSKAVSIGELGKSLKSDPTSIESLVKDSDARMQTIALLLGINISPLQSHAEQAAAIRTSITGMQNSYESQLADANKQLAALNGDMKELDETRFKLNLKREAEAKIAQLAKLFDSSKVEIFLTTDADVIIRMKSMNFRSGSAVIPPESYELLDQAGKAINLFGDREIRVEGHTDSVGDDQFNQELSERRAATVQEFLEARFAEMNRTFTAMGFGEQKPIANNEKEEGRQQNRRIDIVLIAPSMHP